MNAILVDTLPELERHLDELRALAKRLARSSEDAEDLVQETAAQALSSAGRLRDPGLLGAWLHQVLRHRWYDLLRRRVLERRKPEVRPAPGEPVDPDPVHRALARLPAADRTLLELRFFQQLNSTELGARLGRPPGTVRAQIYHALKRFETEYAKENA